MNACSGVVLVAVKARLTRNVLAWRPLVVFMTRWFGFRTVLATALNAEALLRGLLRPFRSRPMMYGPSILLVQLKTHRMVPSTLVPASVPRLSVMSMTLVLGVPFMHVLLPQVLSFVVTVVMRALREPELSLFRVPLTSLGAPSLTLQLHPVGVEVLLSAAVSRLYICPTCSVLLVGWWKVVRTQLNLVLIMFMIMFLLAHVRGRLAFPRTRLALVLRCVRPSTRAVFEATRTHLIFRRPVRCRKVPSARCMAVAPVPLVTGAIFNRRYDACVGLTAMHVESRSSVVFIVVVRVVGDPSRAGEVMVTVA